MAAPAATDYWQYVFWSLVVCGTVAFLGVVLLVLRRKIRPDAQAPRQVDAFSGEALETMRQGGQIDEAEFRSLRRTALGLDAPERSEDNAASSDGGRVSMNEESGN